MHLSAATIAACERIQKRFKSAPLIGFAERGELSKAREWALAQIAFPEDRADDCDPSDVDRLGQLADDIKEALEWDVHTVNAVARKLMARPSVVHHKNRGVQ